MRRAPREFLLLALVTTATCFAPQPGRAAESVEAPDDYATVGRVVTRFVDGRAVIVIPVAGLLRPKLSEPIRDGKRWRLDLVLEDAKLAINAPTRRTEGVASLTVREIGGDVRITVEVDALGDYGARRSEEGLLLWIDAERRTPATALPASVPTSIPIGSTGEGGGTPTAAQSAPDRPARRNWVGWFGLVVAAAATGAAVRSVRRNGWPDWASDLRTRAGDAIRDRLAARSDAGPPDSSSKPAVQQQADHVPFGTEPADPTGRSADIGDAFRVQPERPASGIAALVATNQNDAE